MNGKFIPCWNCGGHGLVNSFGEPDECPKCGGSGALWQYESGLIAQYYSGPICGRNEPEGM